MTQLKQAGKALTTRTRFSRETSVEIDINASAGTVWNLLTDAANYPKWNSTVISIDGRIEPGQKIKLKSTLDPKRVFKLAVKEFIPNQKLVWGDGQGNRVIIIRGNSNGSITFSMTEKIGGLMFPLYAKLIPSFDDSFEKFARDLKTASEKR